MSVSLNDEFTKFIKSFDKGSYENHKYYDSVTEISRKKSGKREPLIEDCEFEMYSLDDIKDGCGILQENPPKTTDALYFKQDGDNLLLYLIEFKFHNLDDPDPKEELKTFVNKIYGNRKKYKCINDYEKYSLNKIKKYYGDNVNHGLILKPIESLKVVIPKLYEEYYNNNPDAVKINIEEYLNTIEKKYYVFVSTYTQKEKSNPEHERLESKSTKLEQHLERLKEGNIIDHYEIWPRCDFKDFLELEQLI